MRTIHLRSTFEWRRSLDGEKESRGPTHRCASRKLHVACQPLRRDLERIEWRRRMRVESSEIFQRLGGVTILNQGGRDTFLDAKLLSISLYKVYLYFVNIGIMSL